MLQACLVASLLLDGAAAFWQPACCATRLPASRIAVQRTALCMCDAEPAVAEEPVAEAPAVVAPPKRKGGAKTPISELEIGAEVTGTIRSVMAYGAFVDIGASTDRLLHVSEISNEFVKDANEKLSAGEEVTCKIKSINLEKNQLALTCKDESEKREPRAPRKARPDLSEYEAADAQQFVTGTVNSITDYGAFITLKEGVDGLCHISSIQEGGVNKVSDVLTIGQEVQVRIVSFDKAKRRIGLSMKEYVEGEVGGRAPRKPRESFSYESSDEEFKMSEEELEALSVEDEGDFSSSFEAAFARASFVQTMKQEKKKYSKQVL